MSPTSRQGVCAFFLRFMVKHTKNDVAISDQTDKEIKTVLRDQLGASSSKQWIRCIRTILLCQT
jgi:hypothetical protein